MSVEIIEDNGRALDGEFLTPTVKTVKSRAESGLLLSFGIIIFLAFAVFSVFDFAAGVILLPLGVFMLIAHIVAHFRAKNGKGNFGLNILAVAYTAPILIQCIFSLWEEVFNYAYMPSFFAFLREITFDLPEPFGTVLNHCEFNTELAFDVLTLVFLCILFIISSLITAKRKNAPSLAAPIFGFIVSVLITAAVFVKELVFVISDFSAEINTASYSEAVILYLSLGTAFLLIACSAMALIWAMNIFVKMKRIKNVIQK